MKGFKRFLGYLICSIFFAMCLYLPDIVAKEPEKHVSSEERKLDEVVVTATRTESTPIDVPVVTEIISAQDIQSSGALTVGDLVGKYITGHYHRYNGLLSPVGMRGFRTESHGDDLKGYVLLLVDGHRIGTGNAAKINLDRIEKIEVIKGPASALYGSAAMGGVINLITKKGTGDFKTTIKGEIGSFEYYKAGLSCGGEVNERLGFHLSASKVYMDDYDDPEYGTVYNTGEEDKNIGGNISFKLNDYHKIRWGGNWADLTSESPGWVDDTYSEYDKDKQSHNDKSHRYTDFEYDGMFLDGKLKWKGMVYYLWDRNHWYTGDPDPDLSQTKYTDETIGTDHQFTYDLSSWNSLLIGFTVESLEKESESIKNGVESLPYTPSMEYETKAAFMQDSIDLFNNRVNIILAARYDEFDLTTKKPGTGTLLNINERSESFDRITPKAGIGIKFLDDLLRFRFNVGSGFKSPSADQLSAQYEKTETQRYLGNPDLDPEKSVTYDVGIDVFHSLVECNLGFFHTDYEDKIVSNTIEYNGLTWSSWKNSGSSEMEGIDFNVKWWIGDTFHLNTDISFFSKVTFNTKYEDEDTGEDLLYISDYEIKSGFNIGYKNLKTALSYIVVGPQMITNYDTYEDEEKGSFSFWDINFRYKFLEQFEATLNIYNIFDQEYEWVRGYLMPERSFRFGLSYTF